MATTSFIPAIKDQVKQKGKITEIELTNSGSQSIGKVTHMMIKSHWECCQDQCEKNMKSYAKILGKPGINNGLNFTHAFRIFPFFN